MTEKTPFLGFGYMRLPISNGKFDFDEVNEMVDCYMGHGFNYFDTAFKYEGSEEALKLSLVDRYPRESFKITTKVNLYGMTSADEMQKQFDTSISRLGVDYVDYYFIHALMGKALPKTYEFGTWDFLNGLKEKGLAKNIGFSFHGTPEELDEVLTDHPEVDMVQLQINYLDWEDPDIRARELYEVARKHNKPVSVMEPTKGGLLASEDSAVGKYLRSVDPDVSAASWAFRWVASLEGIKYILSGMGNTYQVEDNAKTFKNFKPLTEEEYGVIARCVQIIRDVPRVPCTECRYCTAGCPMSLPIPTIIKFYNETLTYAAEESSKYVYKRRVPADVRASNCIGCKNCEEQCPQHIKISDIMKLASEKFDN